MAKTFTIEGIEIQSIVINNIRESNPVTGVLEQTGYSCNVTYFLIDAGGKRISNASSLRYTTGTSYPDAEKLSTDSEKLVMDLVNAMITNMEIREELTS